jgi:NAD(P)H-dependent FMN reductase
MNSSTVLIVTGGNHADSVNIKIAKALPSFAPEGMTFSFAEIASLPLYSQDSEAAFPDGATALKEAVAAADGIIFVTPEHNRSIPAVLKNGIDWASRPWGTNSWAGKPALIMGATPGMVGTSLAQAHLRIIAQYLDMHVLGQPEVYITGVMDKLGADGSLTDEKTKELLSKALATLDAFIAKMK